MSALELCVRGGEAADAAEPDANRRILIIDDNAAIHDDFRKVLTPRAGEHEGEVDALVARLFGGEVNTTAAAESFELDFALQGRDGLAKATAAIEAGRPYALAFVDVRMPPGWDGVETVEQLWRVDPDLQVVICSAYSDYSWEDMRRRLGSSDGLLLLKKPFDSAEVNQLAHALTRKWGLHRAARRRTEQLEELVKKRTAAMEAAHTLLSEEHARRERMQEELRLAQKLEAIGQLAAGIAHEINTPTQYVTHSVQFLGAAIADLRTLNKSIRVLATTPLADNDVARQERVALLEAHERTADLSYLDGAMRDGLAAALDGLDRIARIVRATADVGRVDRDNKAPVDINRALSAALEIARGEYKLYADVAASFGDLPAVTCFGGAMSQVFVNIIVNAAHAIRAVVERAGGRGQLSLRTQLAGADVVIEIADTGGGIPDAIKHRIFDPFFTTKELGEGTGQGLAIARTIVVDRHSGALTFTSTERGTTFNIRIPVDGIDRTTPGAPAASDAAAE